MYLQTQPDCSPICISTAQSTQGIATSMWYFSASHLIFQYPTVDAKLAEVDLKEDFEDIKGTIRFRISKKNRQHNVQQKKDKRTNDDQQNIDRYYYGQKKN
jgi:hypothetical protein